MHDRIHHVQCLAIRRNGHVLDLDNLAFLAVGLNDFRVADLLQIHHGLGRIARIGRDERRRMCLRLFKHEHCNMRASE